MLMGKAWGGFAGMIAADEIPWDEVAFRTAREALMDWVALAHER
jgi:hypothetical protein